MSKLNSAKTIQLPIDPAFQQYYSRQKSRGKLKFGNVWKKKGKYTIKDKQILH